jgi:iron-sulfur cluster repair protein YtfE (RIC family)
MKTIDFEGTLMLPADSAPTIRQWLRKRPATAGVFEDLSGHSFWSRLDYTLAGLCLALNLDFEKARDRIAATEPAHAQEAWLSAPLYRLVDFLTENHAEFRAHDLPRMEHLLGVLRWELGLDSAPAEAAQRDFLLFRREFEMHMEEEENFLFPKILSTEACLRHPELYPEVFKGSLAMYPQAQMHLPEKAFLEMLASLTLKVRILPYAHSHGFHLEKILSEILSFGTRLQTHTGLEAEILFRRASAMEADLRKRSAQSQSGEIALP